MNHLERPSTLEELKLLLLRKGVHTAKLSTAAAADDDAAAVAANVTCQLPPPLLIPLLLLRRCLVYHFRCRFESVTCSSIPNSILRFLHLSSAGITFTFIENSGLLETAENLGLLSAAADRWKLCTLNLRISPLDLQASVAFNIHLLRYP